MARYAISDIHGCNLSFQSLLDSIALSKADQLFLLGDYIHRGPDSIGVIDTIMKLQSEGYQLRCLKGNHEDMIMSELFIGYMHLGERPLYDPFMRELLKKFGSIPESYYNFMQGLETMVVDGQYILVHAGINFTTTDPFEETRDMVWIRDWYHQIDYNLLGDRYIIHGHIPITRAMQETQLVNLQTLRYLDIDAGCVFSTPSYRKEDFEGHLCAFNLDTQEMTWQECIDL